MINEGMPPYRRPTNLEMRRRCPMMEAGKTRFSPWASPPLVSTAMDFPWPDKFSKSLRVSCRLGADMTSLDSFLLETSSSSCWSPADCGEQ